jgi:prolyl oligopeptidase
MVVPGTLPPPTRRQDVADVYHGVRVADPYRWLEAQSTERDRWLEAQNAYTRRVLDALPGRGRLRAELREANRGVDQVDLLRIVGREPRVFALRRGINDESSKLVVRDGWDGADRVLVDPNRRGEGGQHVTIDVASPSPDGRYVAYAVSAAGSEDGTIEVVEVESGRVLPDRIDRTQIPVISWRPDGRSFFYWRRAKLGPDSHPADYYKNSATYLHVLGSDPDTARPIIGAGMRELGLGSHDYTSVEVTPRSRWAVARVVPTAAKVSFFVASLAQVRPGGTPWRRVAAIEDGVVSMLAHADRLFALTYGGAPNYRIVSLDARAGSIAGAKDFVPESDLVLYDFAGARDAMYVVALDRGINRLFRVSWRTGIREEITLPFAGAIGRLISDPTRSGLLFNMEGWIEQSRWFGFDPKTGKVHEIPIVSSASAPGDLMTEEVTVVSRDGAEVPLSIVRRRDKPQDGTSPAFLYAYGAYGTAMTPSYNPFNLTWVRRGGIHAICHVRGGSERGESWHSDGIRQKKENGVDDLLACGEYLVDRKYTRPARLIAYGASAGGIVIGGAITKKPDLFRAAVVRAGTLNLMRMDVTEGGPLHLEEYGDPKLAADFRSLLASDPYHRVRDGVVYPAVLLTTGLHDPRVPPWMPAKFAARLQAAGRTRPTLLRVDMDAGHGIGSTETQRENEYADIYAFALWQAGIEMR